MEFDIIIGIHSITKALENPLRKHHSLVATKDGIEELIRKGNCKTSVIDRVKVDYVSSHALQEKAKKICRDLDYSYQRIPSQVFLITSPIQTYEVSWLYDELKSGKIVKIFCLDSVTDVHNGAAIMRTAAFYGVDAIVTSIKGSFGRGPSFSRIASGAVECVKTVKCASLSRVIRKLLDFEVECIGFSEHATMGSEDQRNVLVNNKSLCLVMGAEDTGLSNAVERVLTNKVAFKSRGEIKSLNVSVAAAIAMEKFFGCKAGD